MEIRSRDELAFRQVYNDVFSVVMKVAYHVTYNTEVSEDICQEAFIKFYDKDMNFPSIDEAKYWLIRVVKNLAINHVNKRAREAATIEKMKKAPQGINPFRDGSSELLLKESREEVRKAVSSLPEMYRIVIILKEYGDLDYKEIGKILNISEANVKVRVHRARKELSVLLNGEVVDVS